MKEFRQAAAIGNLEQLKALYESGQVADINEGGKDTMKTALHWAAQKGHLKAVQYIITLKGVRIDALDKEGNTPFNLCAQSTDATLSNKLCIIDLLLNHHADPLIPNKTGKTSFMNMTTFVRGQGTTNQQDFFKVQVKKIKCIIAEKAKALESSVAIRRDGTVVFEDIDDLIKNTENLSISRIGIIGLV